MDQFNQNTRMADVIHSNYLLLPVINRFGIHLGFGDKTVGEICDEHTVDIDFFLAIINAYNDPDYFPENELRAFSSSLIVEYLKKSHQFFIKTSLPKIEFQLDKMVKSSASDDLKIIKTFYDKYKEELLEHIKDEEENTFPYVLELQQVYDNSSSPVPDHINSYSIQSFEKEHTNVDEKLDDLKNIIIKFLKPDYSDKACNEFLFELFQFERDLTDHARIEDQILVPKVMDIEGKIKNGQ